MTLDQHPEWLIDDYDEIQERTWVEAVVSAEEALAYVNRNYPLDDGEHSFVLPTERVTFYPWRADDESGLRVPCSPDEVTIAVYGNDDDPDPERAGYADAPLVEGQEGVSFWVIEMGEPS